MHYGLQVPKHKESDKHASPDIPEQLYTTFTDAAKGVDISIIVSADSITQELTTRILDYDKLHVEVEYLILVTKKQNDLRPLLNKLGTERQVSVFLNNIDAGSKLKYLRSKCSGKFIIELNSERMPSSAIIGSMLSEMKSPEVLIVTAQVSNDERSSFYHKMIANLTKKLAHFLLPQSSELDDPFNSLMLVRRETLEGVTDDEDSSLSPLKIIVKRNLGSKEHVNLKFTQESYSANKPGFRDMISYLLMTLKLANYRPLRFLIVGIIGVIVNEGLLALLHIYIPVLEIISPIAIEASILSNYTFNALWTFRERSHSSNRGTFSLFELIKYNVVALGGLAVNLIVLLILTDYGMEYLEANVVGIVLGFILNYIGSEKIVWKFQKKTE